MITPRFKLSQDDDSVSIVIRAPYCNLGDLEVYVDDCYFLFTCKPYYLRLVLPGSLQEECKSSSFNSDTGEFIFNYDKTIEGENFKNLEFITKFLIPKLTKDDDEIVFESVSDNFNIIKNKHCEYGFAMKGLHDFDRIIGEYAEVLNVDPRITTMEDRNRLRRENEGSKFDFEHYQCDFNDDDNEITDLLRLEAPWVKLNSSEVAFTDMEFDFLKDLTNVDYQLNKEEKTYCYTTLIDILFAYCYDKRTTYFEGTCESGWTIVQLAASLSWLVGFKTVRESIICGFRRSLIFPLYRSFELCQQVHQDLKDLLRLGEKYIIKCLIELYHIFLKGGSCRYILNDLFINDYIVYIMKWDSSEWEEIVSHINTLKMEKSELCLQLSDIEEDVYCKQLCHMTINESDSDDSSDTDCTSDTDESDSCSNSDSSELDK